MAQYAVGRAEFYLPPDLHAGNAPQLVGYQSRHRQVVQYIIIDKADDKPVGSVYYRDIDNHNRSAEYGILRRGKRAWQRPRHRDGKALYRFWLC